MGMSCQRAGRASIWVPSMPPTLCFVLSGPIPVLLMQILTIGWVSDSSGNPQTRVLIKTGQQDNCPVTLHFSKMGACRENLKQRICQEGCPATIPSTFCGLLDPLAQ